MQIMSDFFMEWYTGLKWVKREYLLPQILNLSWLKCSEEDLLTGPKIQAKISRHSGDCVLGEVHLYALPLMAKS